MKKTIAVLLISCLCFAMASCGASTLTGEPAVFTNLDKSFSIELPAEDAGDGDKASWTVNEETEGDVLDMTYHDKTVRVVVQGLSKAKASQVAGDFESYKKYAVENTFAEILEGADMKDASVEVPDFVSSSSAGTYTAKKGEGIIVFMESDRAYYTYLVSAADGGYSANKKVLEESILSLKELSESE